MGMFAFTAEYQQRQKELEKERLEQVAKWRTYEKPKFKAGGTSSKAWEVSIDEAPQASIEKKPTRRRTRKPAADS